MIAYLRRIYREWKNNREFKRRIKEFKKRDPFNYKNF